MSDLSRVTESKLMAQLDLEATLVAYDFVMLLNYLYNQLKPSYNSFFDPSSNLWNLTN